MIPYQLKRIIKNGEFYNVFLVSGGVDSIAASHWMAHRFRAKIDLILHFNHNLRPQNDEMEASVEAFWREHFQHFGTEYKCIELAYPCEKRSESHLRAARMAHIKDIATNKSSLFNSAHHISDVTESYAANCMTGNPEYMPIQWATDLQINNSYIVHPFLRFNKQYFIDYAKDQNLIQFVVEDETNKSNNYRRNHIRNVILPEMSKWSNIEKIVKRKFLTDNNINALTNVKTVVS